MNIETDIQAFIEKFNKDFSVKLNNQDTTFLIDLFENFVSLSMSAVKGENLDKLVDLEDEINSTYNERDKKLFDSWNKLQDNLFSKEIQQAFVYGVSKKE